QQQFEVALLIDQPTTQGIAEAMNKLLNDTVLYERLRQSALNAGSQWNWDREAGRLVAFWNEILPLH
ncbi:MAG TPA: hypothetical protein VLL95_06460, partial [Phnomibacter sp.]|nr:hypothetical protein [Phnomibacter sp.]